MSFSKPEFQSKVKNIHKIIIDEIQNTILVISKDIEGEGRAGSLKDEGSIIKYLKQVLKDRHNIVLERPQARCFADFFIIVEYDNEKIFKIPYNIKTSKGKGSDNAFSKAGILYALTSLDINNIPKRMDMRTFWHLLNTYSADIPYKDYWYLSVDKNRPSNCIIRGIKQIENWRMNANPSNILQINWKLESKYEPASKPIKTRDEVYNKLKGLIIESCQRYVNSLPKEFGIAVINPTT